MRCETPPPFQSTDESKAARFAKKKRGMLTMRFMTCLIAVVAVLAVAGFQTATLQAADKESAQSQDQWRYTFRNGEWWYWLPANRWVYWRDNQWNDYNPKTFVAASSAGVVAVGPNSSSPAGNSDTLPFYGRVIGDLDRRPQQPNNEVGPFYGNPLPTERFSGSRRGIRPFYGRAASN
jgi:hypothetical protein